MGYIMQLVPLCSDGPHACPSVAITSLAVAPARRTDDNKRRKLKCCRIYFNEFVDIPGRVVEPPESRRLLHYINHEWVLADVDEVGRPLATALVLARLIHQGSGSVVASVA